MARKFKSEEEKKAWGQKMKEIRAKKRAERETKKENISQTNASQVEASNNTGPPLGYVRFKHNSGDLLTIQEWLANDLEKRGEGKRV